MSKPSRKDKTAHSFRLREDVYETASALAFSNGTTVTYLLEKLLRKEFERENLKILVPNNVD